MSVFQMCIQFDINIIFQRAYFQVIEIMLLSNLPNEMPVK